MFKIWLGGRIQAVLPLRIKENKRKTKQLNLTYIIRTPPKFEETFHFERHDAVCNCS